MFLKGAWQGGKATQLHTSLVTNPSDINDFAIAYLVDNQTQDVACLWTPYIYGISLACLTSYLTNFIDLGCMVYSPKTVHLKVTIYS